MIAIALHGCRNILNLIDVINCFDFDRDFAFVAHFKLRLDVKNRRTKLHLGSNIHRN